MRKLFKYAAFLGTVLFLTGCEEYENLVYTNSEGFIQLTSDAPISVVENSTDIIDINYILDAPKTSAVTIDILVTSDDPSRYEIISDQSLTVDPGETEATFQIRPVNNFDTDGNIDVVVSLQESSSLPVGIGGENVNAVSRTITIADDDCPLTITDWVGTYSVSEVFTAGTNEGLTLAGAFGESYQLELSLDPDDVTGTKVIVNNSAGFNEYVPDGTVLTFLSCDGAVSFDAGDPRIAVFAVHALESTPYSESDFSITGSGPLGNFGPYEWVWTKQ